LQEILSRKREEVLARKAKTPLKELKGRIRDLAPARDFLKAISRKGREKMPIPVSNPSIRLIAELKKASPSKGPLRGNFDPEAIAKGYEEAGASALSVLTDVTFFQGSPENLCGAKGWVSLPLLQKDFILEEYQIGEARVWGADAVLLISTLLDRERLKDLSDLALEIGLIPLIEIHDRADLERALGTHPKLIGINNRNLTTFQVDMKTTLDLIGDIPPESVVISESGISKREEVVWLEEAGLDAVLIGEALVKSEDPGMKVRELLGKLEH
jgi:indole-3-glycerol phosphate synthase